MKQDYFISYDGTKLVRYEFDCQNPKAIVQIAHGMQEYSATYFPFAQFLSDNGYKVVLFDQRGHGKSVKPEHLGMVNKEEKNQTTMPKHSMAEALGRSQVVSFNGTNKVRNTKFESE